MICVECGGAVNELYKEYGHANIRLTRCQRCNKIVDKYVEYDIVLIVLDLVLLRATAYRHFLFNRTPYYERGVERSYVKLFVLYVALEAWIKFIRLWSRLEEQRAALDVDVKEVISAERAYILVLAASGGEFLVYLIGVALAVRLTYATQYAIIKYNYVVMAVLLSSFGKLFTLFMMVWDYDLSFLTLVNLFVMASNVVALRVFLDTNILHAASFVAVGFCLKVILMMTIFLSDPLLGLHII